MCIRVPVSFLGPQCPLRGRGDNLQPCSWEFSLFLVPASRVGAFLRPCSCEFSVYAPRTREEGRGLCAAVFLGVLYALAVPHRGVGNYLQPCSCEFPTLPVPAQQVGNFL